MVHVFPKEQEECSSSKLCVICFPLFAIVCFPFPFFLNFVFFPWNLRYFPIVWTKLAPKLVVGALKSVVLQTAGQRTFPLMVIYALVILLCFLENVIPPNLVLSHRFEFLLIVQMTNLSDFSLDFIQHLIHGCNVGFRVLFYSPPTFQIVWTGTGISFGKATVFGKIHMTS